MVSRKFIITLFIIALYLSLSVAAWAGWIIDQVIYSSASSQGGTNQRINSTNYFSKNRFKAIQGSSILIVNYDTDRIFVSDRDRKLYWSGTVDEYVRGVRDYMTQAKREIEESMKNLPPEQRGAMEEEMRRQERGLGEAKGPTEVGRVRVEKTSDRQSIAGYRATRYRVNLGENRYQDIWISEDLDISKDIDMKKMQDFQNRIDEAVGSVYSEGSNIERSPEYQSLFEKGYPLKIVHIVGQDKGVIEVTSVKETEVSDREFQVPEGYRKTTLQEIIRTGGGREGQ